jgi:RNase adapter protein RapZ
VAERADKPTSSDVIVVAGLSGAGRSEAAADLEDLGWFVVDNLPVTLIEKFVDLGSTDRTPTKRLALVVRTGSAQDHLLDTIDGLRERGHRVRILFLEASSAELLKRYGTSRRRHPAGVEQQSIAEAIEFERELLDPVKSRADLVIDTSDLNVHQLRAELTELFGTEMSEVSLQTTIESFGFKHGLPLDVDMVIDCRFLPNPHWIEALREQSGLDDAVRDYVLGQEATKEFLERLESLLDLLLPAYAAEGKSYLTIAFGCTGGRHRSVAIAEEVAERLRAKGASLRVVHRDLDRPG